MPMKFIISSEFGAVEQVRNGQPHTGIDIPLQVGTKLRSIADGVVERVVDQGHVGLGKGVIIRATDGTHHIYGHLSKVSVKVGEKIHAGKEVIGLSGNTGNSTGPHLHFGVQLDNGEFLDPTPVAGQIFSLSGNSLDGKWYLGGQPEPGSWLDKLNHWADGTVQTEKDYIANPAWAWIKGQLIDLGHWIVSNLPDIMGYVTVMAGACIILGSMIGKGGMMKPLCVYAGMLIVSFLILTGYHKGV